MNKLKQIATGFLIGSILTASVGVFAASNSYVQALLDRNVQFNFNGEYKSVPEEYGGALIYNDRIYVPARFVAENIGAKVLWNGESRTAVFSVEKESPVEEKPQEGQKPETPDQQIEQPTIESPIDQAKDKQPVGNYRKLPVIHYAHNLDLTVTFVAIGDQPAPEMDYTDRKYTRVFLEIKNKKDNALQLLQMKTKMIVDGKEYKIKDISAHELDYRWFNDIYDDETRSGYLTLPLIPENAKEMQLTLYVQEGGYTLKEHEITFDIDLEK